MKCIDRFKLVVLAVGITGTLVFFVLLVLKFDEYAKAGDEFLNLDWISILAPLAASMGLILIWVLLNFIVNAPLFVIPVHTGPSAWQTYTHHLQQLLVTQVDAQSIETYIEASVLRDILNAVLYGTIITYCALSTRFRCQKCPTPYLMVDIGFLVCYALRLVMLVYNGAVKYIHLKSMLFDVRFYQEALDSARLQQYSIPHLYELGQRHWARIVDAFLWCTNLAFLVLGTIWVHNSECASICRVFFHINTYMMLAVLVAECWNALGIFCLAYYFRVSGLEQVDELIAHIAESRPVTKDSGKDY